ncbi:hypothetical protein DSO57_1030179 [Entomophthora muscae]|uniref:Uncharacterized protein n=2 Tax=Entomophthora muscae TaxID=34485 RepID=A0ACC2SBP5_9FUNG|nr:hypothetical protein DSO57_1037551 [Entomophthora muscae]KAJ9064476.1 hypothetical protein DSO57_1030179 [Entomophthora muscae]
MHNIMSIASTMNVTPHPLSTGTHRPFIANPPCLRSTTVRYVLPQRPLSSGVRNAPVPVPSCSSSAFAPSLDTILEEE